MKITRLFDIIYHQNEKYPQPDAFVNKENGQWIPVSTQKMIEEINAYSRALLAMGFKKGDKIAMISNNRTEWCIMDYAMLQIGVINVPIYPTISKEDYEYIFNHAEIKMCLVSDKELLEKVLVIQNNVPTLTKGIFTFNTIEGYNHWTEIKKNYETISTEELEKIKASISEDDLATLIYTSGTTGKPKGVMLTHKNIVSNVMGSKERVPVNETAKALSFLPVCHVYERMLLYLYAYIGVSVYFAESIDTIGDNLREVHPNLFTAVPRLIEKVYDKIVAKGNELTGIKRALFFWALELGEKFELEGKSWWYHFQLKIANKIIFSKWREAVGGNVQCIVSGAAALNPRLARIFFAAQMPILEGYGLTETSPVISVNSLEKRGGKFGTVGRPLKNVTVKIASDGEIIVKGPNVMKGYYKNPELTKEVIDADGFFHTGDIGEIDSDGFLKITDRKKEMFKTSGGKYIAPQQMENKFKESRFIEQIMVVGEGEKHPAALIVPDFEFLQSWAKRKGIHFADNKDLISNPKVVERYQEEVDKYNASFGKWEQIKKFELVPHSWSVETGELTPTLKLKRKIIKEKYKDLIDKIYEKK